MYRKKLRNMSIPDKVHPRLSRTWKKVLITQNLKGILTGGFISCLLVFNEPKALHVGLKTHLTLLTKLNPTELIRLSGENSLINLLGENSFNSPSRRELFFSLLVSLRTSFYYPTRRELFFSLPKNPFYSFSPRKFFYSPLSERTSFYSQSRRKLFLTPRFIENFA